jgi:hypothetical protein
MKHGHHVWAATRGSWTAALLTRRHWVVSPSRQSPLRRRCTPGWASYGRRMHCHAWSMAASMHLLHHRHWSLCRNLMIPCLATLQVGAANAGAQANHASASGMQAVLAGPAAICSFMSKSHSSHFHNISVCAHKPVTRHPCRVVVHPEPLLMERTVRAATAKALDALSLGEGRRSKGAPSAHQVGPVNARACMRLLCPLRDHR